MPKLPKNNGLRLFNKCAKQVKKEFEKQGRPEKWNEIQKWTSANVYPKFKGKSVNQVKVADIKKEIGLALGTTPPKKVSPCFSVFAVNKADLDSTEWWDIENTIQGLPNNVQIRVNGGSDFGRTRIDQAQNINTEIDVQPIIEKIREYMNNNSGLFFDGIIKVVPNKKDDGSNCSYFIDFVISDKDKPLVIEGEVVEDREVPTKDTGRVERIKKVQSKKRQTKRQKLKKAKTQKRPTKSKKTTQPKTKEKRTPLADKNRAKEILLEEFKLGLITKAEYREGREKIDNMYKEGGIV